MNLANSFLPVSCLRFLSSTPLYLIAPWAGGGSRTPIWRCRVSSVRVKMRYVLQKGCNGFKGCGDLKERGAERQKSFNERLRRQNVLKEYTYPFSRLFLAKVACKCGRMKSDHQHFPLQYLRNDFWAYCIIKLTWGPLFSKIIAYKSLKKKKKTFVKVRISGQNSFKMNCNNVKAF